jgi:hypothetical protein
MLSFLSSIKNRIREKLSRRKLLKRARHYQVVVMGSDIIHVDTHETDTSSSDTIENSTRQPSPSPSLQSESPPPPPCSTPTKMVCLFGREIEESLIKNDYELQTLLLRMKARSVDIENIKLESRFEDLMEKIPNANELFKAKLRILYIIIALHYYSDFFEEKKQYRALNGSHCLGVFRFNDYIIRIDDSPYSFINERDVICALKQKEGSSDNIVVPFLTYINIKKDERNKMCECNTIVCGCKYDDGEDHYEKINMMSHDGKHYYNIMRKNSISFSIQHYAKNTEQLYHWVKDNIGNSIYNQFSNIQYPFFVNLFLKCAKLIRDLHNADVVHGDIKPDNILIREHDNFNLHNITKCKNFTVYLIDFGLSGMNNEGFGTGGTIPYCHPEFKNIRDTSRTSKYNWKRQQLKHDVWSLGIVFITMYIYRDFYSYYHKYPDYFFTKEGYVSSLILDVIADSKLHEIFTKILSENSISIHEVCTLLEAIDK